MKQITMEGKVTLKSVNDEGVIRCCVEWPDPRFPASRQTQSLWFDDVGLELGQIVRVAIWDGIDSKPPSACKVNKTKGLFCP